MAIRCILLLLSVFGALLGYRRFCRLPVSFFPALYASACALTLYGFALAGILRAGYWVLIALGIFQLIVCSWKARQTDIVSLAKEPALIFLLLGVVWAFLVTRGTNTSHIDDFTHWFHICKTLHFDGTLPHTTELEFYNYVPGTALFISFITEFIGFSVPNCFFAQNCLNIACLCALFTPMASAHRRGIGQKALLFLFASAGSLVLCSITYGVYELLVDTIVALTAVTAYMLTRTETEGGPRTLGVALLLCFCALIKNTGMLFAVLVVVTWLIEAPKAQRRWSAALLAGGPIAVNLSYLLRTKLIFAAADSAPHSLSLSRFLSVFRQKTWEMIGDVITRFAWRSAGLEGTPQVIALWVFFFALIFAAVFLRKRDGGMTLRTAAAAGVSIAAYLAFLLAMYLFSMPIGDDWALATYERYVGTLTVFVGGIVLCALLCAFAQAEEAQSRRVLAVLCGTLLAVQFVILPVSYVFGYSHYKPIYPYTREMADLMDDILPESELPDDHTYLIIWDDAPFVSMKVSLDKAEYGLKTRLRTHNVKSMSLAYFEQLETTDPGTLEWMLQSDYVVFFSDMDGHQETLMRLLGIEKIRPGITPLCAAE